MPLGILNMRHLIVGQVGIKIITSITGGEESNPFMEVGWHSDLTQCRTVTEVKHGRARSGVG